MAQLAHHRKNSPLVELNDGSQTHYDVPTRLPETTDTGLGFMRLSQSSARRNSAGAGDDKHNELRRQASFQIKEFGEVGAVSFMSRVTCCTFVAVVVYLTISCALATFCVVIGAMFIIDCPGQRTLPIVLVCTGAVTLVTSNSDLITVIKKKRAKDDDQYDEHATVKDYELKDLPLPKISMLMTTLRLAHLVLFIALNVLVFDAYQEMHVQLTAGGPFCCRPFLYWTSFGYLVAHFVEIGIWFVCCVGFCCCCFIFWFKKWNEADSVAVNANQNQPSSTDDSTVATSSKSKYAQTRRETERTMKTKYSPPG